MKKPAQYLNQRIRRATVEALRKHEKKHKLKPSISNTIDDLLEKAWKNESLQ